MAAFAREAEAHELLSVLVYEFTDEAEALEQPTHPVLQIMT
jgi:hypothetical protein